MISTTVGKVVPVDDSDDGVSKVHRFDGIG
jgi:hypothetical protein